MKKFDALKLVLGSVVVYGIVAACSGGSSGHFTGDSGKGPVPDAQADVSQSGSRLKAQVVTGADGSKAFTGLFDTQTKQECAYANAADGSYRCLPSGIKAVAATSFFNDAKCTQPILNVPAGCTAPAFVSTVSASCGNTQFHIFPTGKSFMLPMTIYLAEAGKCNAVPTKNAMGTWYEVGAELAPSTFVLGTITTE